MPDYKNAAVTIAMVSLGALFSRLIEHLLDGEVSKKSYSPSNQEDSTDRIAHEIVHFDEDGELSSNRTSRPRASTSAHDHIDVVDFGTLTSMDIATGFYIIREWEFTKYKFNEREREIAGMLMDGLSNKQIAKKACLGESSVKYHISSIFRKTSLKNRNDFGSLIKRGMQKSTRQWSSRSEMNKELELLKNRRVR